jgi:hypothetical protein
VYHDGTLRWEGKFKTKTAAQRRGSTKALGEIDGSAASLNYGIGPDGDEDSIFRIFRGAFF